MLVASQLARARAHTSAGGYAQPLGLLYWVMRAWGCAVSEQAVWLGAFGTLCMCSIDLFDDVQDDDLEGKPLAAAGPAIATNTALAMLFLAIDALRHAQELESRPAVKGEYVKVFNRVSLVGVGCQHQDLIGARGARSSGEVMERDSGKTAIVSLFLESGALLAGCEPATVARYRSIGGKLASLVQIVDDLRDLYAKAKSPDLMTGKLTYPLACFREYAGDVELRRFESLVAGLPGSLQDIGELLYESGAVEQCALTLERLRHEIHAELAAIGNVHGGQRVLVRIVDDLCQTVYAADNLDAGSESWGSGGAFHTRLTKLRSQFEDNVAAWEPPTLPSWVPWQQAHFFSQPELGICFYPDVDDLPEEVLGIHAQLLGTNDVGAAIALHRDAEYFVAHEMFHCWRHAADVVSDDHWHEEYVCDRLALGYLAHFRPQVLDALLRSATEIVRRYEGVVAEECRALALEAAEPSDARQCALDHQQTALWHALVVMQVAPVVGTFDSELLRWLGAVSQRQTAA